MSVKSNQSAIRSRALPRNRIAGSSDSTAFKPSQRASTWSNEQDKESHYSNSFRCTNKQANIAQRESFFIINALPICLCMLMYGNISIHKHHCIICIPRRIYTAPYLIRGIEWQSAELQENKTD